MIVTTFRFWPIFQRYTGAHQTIQKWTAGNWWSLSFHRPDALHAVQLTVTKHWKSTKPLSLHKKLWKHDNLCNLLYYHQPAHTMRSCSQLLLWQLATRSIQGIQHHGTSYLELSVSVSSYEKFRYHHHFQGNSENWTVLCCIWHSLTFLPPSAPPIRTLDIQCCL